MNVQGGMHDILVSKYYKHVGAIVERYGGQVMIEIEDCILNSY